MKYAILSLLILSLSSCHPYPGDNQIEITTYNAFAFFDDYEDGNEFDGFSRSDGYDGAAYRTRIKQTAILLGTIYSSSDIIILQEIESIAVLEDLLKAGLDKKGYRYYGLAEDDENTLFVGFISRISPLRVSIHDSIGCRPIIEIVLNIGGEIIHIFGVHFKSRLNGGDEERDEQSRHLARLFEMNSDSLCIAAGDFNTDPTVHDSPFSLFPECYCPDNAFHITGDPSQSAPFVYFSPLHDPDAVLGEEGSYFHDGYWYCYDALYLSSCCWDGKGLEYDGIEIRTERTMKDRGGRPFPYDVSTGYGYSDHFPVTLRLSSSK